MQNKRLFMRNHTVPIPKLRIQTVEEEKSLFHRDDSHFNDKFSSIDRYKLRTNLTNEKPSDEKET